MASETTPRARMSDVAELAGVSVQSVSNYSSGPWARLSLSTRDRIEAAIKSLGYRVNNSARGLRSSRTRTLGFLVLDDSERFAADPLTALYMAGIADTARDHGYSVLVHASRHSPGHAEFLRPINEGRVDAACVLLSGQARRRRDVVKMLDRTPIEYVLFDETTVANASERALVVRADQASGSAALVDHLVERGHRRIAFIAARAPWAVVEQRHAAYVKSLRRHGIAPDPQLAVFEGGWEPTGAALMIEQLLAANDAPTAIMCGSDFLAIGAMRTLRQMGLSVPDDIAVCGYDDFDVSAHVFPELTTVSVPAWEMGSTAARMLIETLDGDRPSSRDLCLPTTVKVRDSA